MKTKSVLLIGLGKFGTQVALKLNELGQNVMAIDFDEKKINDVMPYVTNAQIGDSTNKKFLDSLGVEDFDVCIVAIGSDFQSSLETSSLLKELGAKKVVSRAESDTQAKFLLRNGADEIVYPEKQLASWMAIRYSADHIMDYIEIDDSHSIFEVSVPKPWVGKSIAQIDIRKKYSINILAIKQNGEITFRFSPDTVLSDEVTLLVLGEQKTLEKCFNM